MQWSNNVFCFIREDTANVSIIYSFSVTRVFFSNGCLGIRMFKRRSTLFSCAKFYEHIGEKLLTEGHIVNHKWLRHAIWLILFKQLHPYHTIIPLAVTLSRIWAQLSNEFITTNDIMQSNRVFFMESTMNIDGAPFITAIAQVFAQFPYLWLSAHLHKSFPISPVIMQL